jgi:hypothetical protein
MTAEDKKPRSRAKQIRRMLACLLKFRYETPKPHLLQNK